MVQILENCDIKLNDDQLNKLWKFHNLIMSKNSAYSLTGIRDYTETILKHYVDCFIISKLINIPFPLLDIGTGAGFPGIPLKILFAKEKIILAENRRKRVQFLREVKKALSLKNTYIYPRAINNNFEIKVKAIITRALEPIENTLHRASSCLETGGLAIFMKGPSADKEIDFLKKPSNTEYSILKNHTYALPLINHKRRLVVLQRKMQDADFC